MIRSIATGMLASGLSFLTRRRRVAHRIYGSLSLTDAIAQLRWLGSSLRLTASYLLKDKSTSIPQHILSQVRTVLRLDIHHLLNHYLRRE